MMEIQCECGKFRAELTGFPKNTPGRLKCYCDDCQAYLHYIGRSDLLDANGGSEIVPAYPAEVKVTAGHELIKCTRLHGKGLYRFATSCCNTPIANTDPKRAWAGMHGRMFTAKDPKSLDQTFGPVKSSIMGKYAKGTPPPGTPETFDMKGMITVLPFILKGAFTGKAKGSPFFEDGQPVGTTKTLSNPEYRAALQKAGL